MPPNIFLCFLLLTYRNVPEGNEQAGAKLGQTMFIRFTDY